MAASWADVTGRGVISSSGLDIKSFEQSVLAGKSSITEIGDYPPQGLRFNRGAPVLDFDPSRFFDERTCNTLDPFSQFAAAAARQAWSEAGLTDAGVPPERVGVVIGSANGGSHILEAGWRRLLNEGKKPAPLSIPMSMTNAPASRVAREAGAQGPVLAVSTACASASHAMVLGLMLIRSGLADVVIAGGTDACFHFGYLQIWDVLRVVSPTICRPFSKDRQGIILGEGAGIVVLERPGQAAARGARVHGHLLGGAMTSDAGDLTRPNGIGMLSAINGALADSGLAAGDIGYINAHGTGTVANDKLEAGAIRAAFGAGVDRVPVSSSKSMFGHAMGASGALEALATLAALEAGIAPPTLNFNEIDPECALDVVPEGPRVHPMQSALSNSFAFGGLNVTLAFGKAGTARPRP